MTKQLLDKILALLYEERKALPPPERGKPYISPVAVELGALRAAIEIISADDCYSLGYPQGAGTVAAIQDDKAGESYPWPKTQSAIWEIMKPVHAGGVQERFDGEAKFLLLDLLRVRIRSERLSNVAAVEGAKP